MGQLFSFGDWSGSRSGGNALQVIIIHKYSREVPSGWNSGGYIRFFTNEYDTIGNILNKINEYRSPINKINNLLDKDGNILSLSTPAKETPFYI
jgi:hypothetical protein